MPVATIETSACHEVEVRYDVRVPMPDGVCLAGNLYLPAGPEAPPTIPAILTLIPYHKDGRGGLGSLDAYHRHFASRGYAVLHLDMRGTGSSEGAPCRAFDAQERQDGHQAVEWVAAQPWCTGNVGIWGISYGGITAMAIAETAPPHLRAIVPIHAPSDNYESMIVHRGARLMFWADPHWGAGMVPSNLMPPLRASDGDDWLRLWRERLDTDPWILDWYGPAPDPNYWEVDAAKIDTPALVICGWQDAYPDSVDQLWPKLTGPKRLLFGPWKHVMPESSTHLPVDTLTLIDRWWDRWLKDEPNGVDEEPPVTIFVQGDETWRQELEWPPARAIQRVLHPGAGKGLGETPGNGGCDEYDYDARAGLGALPYDACTGSIPYPQDQSFDDYLSLAYTSEPLAEPLETTGLPAVRLVFAADIPVAELNLSAKLCDVSPGGGSDLVTFEHVSGARAELVSGGIDDNGQSWYAVEFDLRPTSYVFAAGHQIRLSVSGSNFPYLWPTPRQYRLRLRREDSWLRLPVVGEQQPPLPAPVLNPPAKLVPEGRLRNRETYWTHREETSRTVSFEGKRENVVAVEPGTTLSILQHFVMTVDAAHPAQANTRTDTVWRLERSSGAVEVRAKTVTTLRDVQVQAEIDLDGFPYYRREWLKTRTT
ncbi:MAG: uncharacterized protein QOF73_3895 [Thermomicrobiales bacterium]|nr:uncharacterized protein [Thermomicrobiales bacterium]